MKNENELVVVNEIDQALAQENVTDQVIASLKKNYLGLTISGKEDKEGYEAVKKARLECRDLRVLATKIAKKGREHATTISRAWIAKEKEVVSQISEVEDYLQDQQDSIDNEEKRIIEERYFKRKEQLSKVEFHGDWTDISTVSDEVFNLILSSAAKEFDEMIAERIKDELIKAEQEEALETQRIQQEEKERLQDERMKEIERKEAEQKAEQEKINSEKKKIEDDKFQAEREKERAVELEKAIEEARLQAIKDEERKAYFKELEDIATARKIQEAEDERLKALPDLEKMGNYAKQLKIVPIPELHTTKAQVELLEAQRYITLACDLLERK